MGNQYERAEDAQSDFWQDRELCAVYYASTDWHPSFGGRFRHCGPGAYVVPIDPRPNRLLLLEPRADCRHDVEPIKQGWPLNGNAGPTRSGSARR
jgi:hypothetical protein